MQVLQPASTQAAAAAQNGGVVQQPSAAAPAPAFGPSSSAAATGATAGAQAPGTTAGGAVPLQGAPAVAPQGLFGNVLGGLVPMAGGMLGGVLPFQAGPQLTPQAAWGSQWNPASAGAMGAALHNPLLATQLAQALGTLVPYSQAFAPQSVLGSYGPASNGQQQLFGLRPGRWGYWY
jgi:hypothetical protein